MIAKRAGSKSGNRRRMGKFRASDIQGLMNKIAYLLSPSPGGKHPRERVAQTHGSHIPAWLPGDDPQRYAERFAADLEEWNRARRGGRAASQNLCIDRSFSFAPGDPVDPDKALRIIRQLIRRVMGPKQRLSLCVVHSDRPHLHVHVIASVVDTSGKIFNPSFDDVLWRAAMDELEIEHGLRRVGAIDLNAHSSLTTPQDKQRLPQGLVGDDRGWHRASQKQRLRVLVEDAVAEARGDFWRFLQVLDRQQIQLVVRQHDEGAGSPIVGVSFHLDGHYFTGTHLSPQLAWPALQHRVGYDDTQHKTDVVQRKKRYLDLSKARCTIKPASETSAGLAVIELPDRKLGKRKETLIKELHSKAVPDLQKVTYRRQADEQRVLFWEAAVLPMEHQLRTGQAGYYQKKNKEEGPRLQTHQGSHRSVIKCMLVRARQLGWRRLVIEGSQEFLRVVKDLCINWLGGRVHDRQVERATSATPSLDSKSPPPRAMRPKRMVIPAKPVCYPQPALSQPTMQVAISDSPARSEKEQREMVPAVPRERPSRGERVPVVEEVIVSQTLVEEDVVTEAMAEPENAPEPVTNEPKSVESGAVKGVPTEKRLRRPNMNREPDSGHSM